MATPEGKVKAKCKRVLKDFGIHYFMPMQNGFGIVGVSDIICCWNGWYLAIETKAPGKKSGVTANQANFLKQVQSNGGLALVIDDAEELRGILMDILTLRKEQADNATHKIEIQKSSQQTGLQKGVCPRSVKSGAEEISGGAEQEEPGKPEGWQDL